MKEKLGGKSKVRMALILKIFHYPHHYQVSLAKTCPLQASKYFTEQQLSLVGQNLMEDSGTQEYGDDDMDTDEEDIELLEEDKLVVVEDNKSDESDEILVQNIAED